MLYHIKTVFYISSLWFAYIYIIYLSKIAVLSLLTCIAHGFNFHFLGLNTCFSYKISHLFFIFRSQEDSVYWPYDNIPINLWSITTWPPMPLHISILLTVHNYFSKELPSIFKKPYLTKIMNLLITQI